MSKNHVNILNNARSKGYSFEYGNSKSNDIIIIKNGHIIDHVFTFIGEEWREELINKLKKHENINNESEEILIKI
jgi:hypothetical protein